MKPQFLTPVVTAFDAKGRVDKEANERIYDRLVQGGMDGIVLLGSVGEFYCLSVAEQKGLVDLAVQTVKDRCKIIVGTSSMCVDESIELSNYAYEKGADAVMVITPYYFDLSDESIEAFYDKIAASINVRLYLYNFPARTGYDLKPEVALKLAGKHKNIIGYKDSVAYMGHTRDLANIMLPEFPEFEIYSGFDENLVHNILSGGAGCIGGLSNIVPGLFSRWIKAVVAGRQEEIKNCQQSVNKMMRIYDVCTPFISAIKQAMILKGVQMDVHSRFPLLPPNMVQREAIKDILADVN